MFFEINDSYLISVCFFIVAAIYSSIGHAGASGYTAVLALFSYSPVLLRPTSLLLNIVVGVIGLYRFYQSKMIDFKKVFPFLVGSIPLTYLSARFNVDKKIFYTALGVLLFYSSITLLFPKVLNLMNSKNNFELDKSLKPIQWPLALLFGSIIGVFSGITGTGGAIFFTPLVLHLKWAQARAASGMSIVFVLVNSIFGFAGTFKAFENQGSSNIFIWIIAVSLGAFVGTHIGINKLNEQMLRKVLGFVLLFASIKLLSLAH